MNISAPRAACAVPVDEQWGEMNTPGIDQNGESGGTGSTSCASRPAPAIQPWFRGLATVLVRPQHRLGM